MPQLVSLHVPGQVKRVLSREPAFAKTPKAVFRCRPIIVHQLERTTFLRAEPEQVWSFFSDPRNLNALTPPEMHFEILGDPGPMREGQLIAYRIRILPGIRVSWLTEIRHVTPGVCFVDEQRIGPYKLWYHEHRFEAVPGGVRMTDRVTYAVGFGPLGDLVHALWIRGKLRAIFDYRERQVALHFG